MSVFYIPVVIYIIGLALRFRGLTFLSVNPGMPMSGLIGERKAAALAQLQGSEFLARFRLLDGATPLAARRKEATAFMQDLALDFPVVLKPDFGQRGMDVAVIRNSAQLEQYLQAATGDVLIQEHVTGEEFGVFYLRHPDQPRGQVFSITEKTFPLLEGDGQSTLEQLLMNNSRTHYMAEYLLQLHSERLAMVLPAGEHFKVVEIGSHCRGSVFFDANRYITEPLRAQMQALSDQIEGFYFGRYDLRAASAEALQEGINFKILEVNGVTSESTDIYDPANSVFTAWGVLCRQWRQAFEIGYKNIRTGAPKVSMWALLSHLRRTYG